MSLSAIFSSQPAIGAIGGALNSIMDARAAKSMDRQAVAQTQQEADFNAAIRERQSQLLSQELARQQIYSRGAGDAFADSLGQFQGSFQGKVDDSSSQIANIYRQFLAQKSQQQMMAEALAPLATGPTADREANERQKASQEVDDEAGRMANVQGFGDAMSGAGRVMQDNEQLAALLRNFSGGSARAGQAEIDSQAGQFTRGQIVPPAQSMLGDLFVGLSGLFGNRPAAAPDIPLQSGVRVPSAPNLDYMGGGQGIRLDRGGSGIVARSNLGIR
jgi:hypothetical protein